MSDLVLPIVSLAVWFIALWGVLHLTQSALNAVYRRQAQHKQRRLEAKRVVTIEVQDEGGYQVVA